MRYFIFAFFIVLMNSSCKNDTDLKPETQVQEDPELITFTAVGEEVITEGILSPGEMHSLYQGMAIGDTLGVRLRTTVNSVCKKKGCWMQLELDGGEEALVTFRNYEVVVPADIETREVVVQGSAYITKLSVEDQQHFAEDAGKSLEEVRAITQPEITFSFLAEGVLIAPGS